MPVKITTSTEQDILLIPVPKKTGRTTIVPYEDIINKIKHSLKEKDYHIISEEYRTTLTGNIVTGVYKLIRKENLVSMPSYTLSWSYSYDKTQRFKCVSGVENILSLDNANSISNNIMDIFNEIDRVILSLDKKYTAISMFASKLEDIEISKTLQSQVLGELFIDKDILTLTQIGSIKRVLNIGNINAWDFFNILNNSLTESHPTTWLTDHIELYNFFYDGFYNIKIDNHKITEQDTTEYLLSSPANKKRLEEAISENYHIPVSGLKTVIFS